MVKFSYSNMTVRSVASGNVLNVPVYRFEGEPGKKTYIQANIHGPEVAGIAAAYRLVELLRKQKTIHGSITVVPSINPVALDLKVNGLQVGYADPNEYTVGNFNRIYQMLVTEKKPDAAAPEAPRKVVLEDFVAAHLKSGLAAITADFKKELMAAVADLKAKKGRNGLRFGLHLALTIQEMAQDADYVIDLHTDARAVYYGYTFAECLDSYRTFNMPYLIELSPDDFDGVFDEAFLEPWIKLQKAFKKAGREIAWPELEKDVITLELGNADQVDRKAADTDAKRIINYLRYKGVLEGKVEPPTQPLYQCRFEDRDHYYPAVGGLVFWHKKVGDWIEVGETVATVLKPGGADENGVPLEVPMVATAAGALINLARSQVAHEGIDVFSILTHLKKV